MIYYTLKRLGLALLVALTVSFISFGLLYLSSDPAIAMAGETASDADIEAIRKLYGFDRPILVQYLDWLQRALSGDLGKSYYFRTDVSALIGERLPTTMTLGVCAITFAIVLSVPLGVAAAIRPNSLIDRLALFLSVMGQALPSFWFALMLIVFLSVNLRLLPTSGSDTWLHFVMPTVVLGYYAAPAIMRLTRTGMLEVLSTDYIRTARAKGLRPWVVLFKHALRNAIIPVVSLAAVQFGFMLGGSIVVETIFGIPGLGRFYVEAAFNRDYTMILGSSIFFSCLIIGLNLVSDLIAAAINPKLR